MRGTWTLIVVGARPLTVNGLVNLHRQQWAKRTQATRMLWFAKGTNLHLPKLDRISIIATPLHENGRSPQDVAACAPEVKAAIDGLVDAGLIPDDDASHLLAVTFKPPRICGMDGLQLTIQEEP